jgi:hypothetical protein
MCSLTSQEKVAEVGMTKLLRHAAPEWYLILAGGINSIIYGGLQPIVSVLFGSILAVSFLPMAASVARKTLIALLSFFNVFSGPYEYERNPATNKLLTYCLK